MNIKCQGLCFVLAGLLTCLLSPSICKGDLEVNGLTTSVTYVVPGDSSTLMFNVLSFPLRSLNGPGTLRSTVYAPPSVDLTATASFKQLSDGSHVLTGYGESLGMNAGHISISAELIFTLDKPVHYNFSSNNISSVQIDYKSTIFAPAQRSFFQDGDTGVLSAGSYHLKGARIEDINENQLLNFNYTLQVMAVPEPSMLGVVTFVAGLCFYRERCKNKSTGS